MYWYHVLSYYYCYRGCCYVVPILVYRLAAAIADDSGRAAASSRVLEGVFGLWRGLIAVRVSVMMVLVLDPVVVQ